MRQEERLKRETSYIIGFFFSFLRGREKDLPVTLIKLATMSLLVMIVKLTDVPLVITWTQGSLR